MSDLNSPGRRVHKVRAGERILLGGHPDPQVLLVLDGWVARSRMLTDGRRQIMELFLAGEQHGLTRTVGGGTVTALSPSTVMTVPRSELLRDMEANGPLADLLTACAKRQEAIIEERLLCLGRRTALERTAHLLCELLVRSEGPQADRCDLNLTQGDLADVLGLSVVHVNRTLQALRKTLSVSVSRSRLHAPDLQGLRRLAEFDPAYLIGDCGTAEKIAPA